MSSLPLAALFLLYLQKLQEPKISKDYRTPNNLTTRILSGSPKIFANKGGCLEGRENSLSAIKQSIAIGIDGVQIDIRKSKNGKFILVADKNLQRLTGQNKNVSDLEFPGEFNPFLQTIKSEFDSEFNDQSTVEEKPASFDEILEEFVNNDTLLVVNVNGDESDTMEVLEKIKLKGYYNEA